jgi:hypothetical protein
MAYTKYSLTPANNTAAPPDGAPEGMLPSAVNDTMRDMMSQIRDVGDGIRGGTYTMTAPVITGGSINGTTVGATTRATGAFTTLASNGATTFTAGTASTSTTTGTAVITGGLGVSGRINAANFDGIVGANTAAAGNFTTLGATGVATFSAGTVSAPAITTSGDTNTGIFFPAADTIAFTEGGAESMRIDSSGQVGIGTGSPSGKLNVSDATLSQININSGATGAARQILFSTATNTQEALISANNSTGEFKFEAGRSGTGAYFQTFYTNNTEVMRISSGQQVGIGKAPAVTLDVNGAINYDPNVSVNGLSVVSRATYDDGVNRSLGAAWNNTFGVITIKGTGGATNIPFFSNGGSGVAFACTTLDPDAGTWSYGAAPTITFTNAGSGGNTFVLAFLGGSGTFNLQRTAGSGSFTVVIQHYTT